MVFYKSILVVLIIALIFAVYGEYDPDSEIESLQSKVFINKELKNKLEEIVKEIKNLRSLLDATKKNRADGPESNSNIKKLIEDVPKKLANLRAELNALENKGLLA